MGWGSREQGIKEDITTSFRTLSPISLLTTTYFMDRETETQKKRTAQRYRTQTQTTKQGPLSAILCLPTRGAGMLQRLLGRTQVQDPGEIAREASAKV